MPVQPAHPNATPFLARLRQMQDQLSPTEKKLALLILDTPIHLGSYSASELAQITDVSNATITRFVRHLGYGTYEEARRQARLEADAAGTLPLPPAAQASANAPNSQALWQAQQDKLRAMSNALHAQEKHGGSQPRYGAFVFRNHAGHGRLIPPKHPPTMAHTTVSACAQQAGGEI